MPSWTAEPRFRLLLATLLSGIAGCHTIPIDGKIRADANVTAGFQGKVDVRLPTATDPVPMASVNVRHAPGGPESPRIGIVDVDGLILNQNMTGLYSVGENPVSAFREKLEAAARDPRFRAVVLRINSPGGGVSSSDIISDELGRFRQTSGKTIVACFMDLATGGVLPGCWPRQIVALPTTVTRAVGAIINHTNPQDAIACSMSRSTRSRRATSSTWARSLRPADPAPALFQEMADGFQDRFADRVRKHRRG